MPRGVSLGPIANVSFPDRPPHGGECRRAHRRGGGHQDSGPKPTSTCSVIGLACRFELRLRSSRGDFARRSHRQFQNFTECLQVFRARPGPAHLPEIHASGSNTNLRSNIGDGQTARQTSITEMLAQTNFTRHGEDSRLFAIPDVGDYLEDRWPSTKWQATGMRIDVGG